MYNFNEQGKFESYDTSKEHAHNIDGKLYYSGNQKSTKDVAIGIVAAIAVVVGTILLVYIMK